MLYCENCGTELTEGVKFCKHCGVRVGGSINESKALSVEQFFTDEVDDMADVEDGEIDDAKGLDPNRSYHMQISGRTAGLYNDWGQLIRRFSMRTNVVQATTSGEMVTICTDDGYTHIYKWDGALVRRFR